MHRILCPTDFSQNSDHALHYAGELAKRLNAKLLIVHVDPDQNEVAEPASLKALDAGAAPIGASNSPVGPVNPPAEKPHHNHPTSGEKLLSAVPEHEGVDYEHLLLQGDPATAIVDAANHNHVDQIIMGVSGRAASSRAPGDNTSAVVVRNSPCPVTFVSDEGAEEVAPTL